MAYVKHGSIGTHVNINRANRRSQVVVGLCDQLCSRQCLPLQAHTGATLNRAPARRSRGSDGCHSNYSFWGDNMSCDVRQADSVCLSLLSVCQAAGALPQLRNAPACCCCPHAPQALAAALHACRTPKCLFVGWSFVSSTRGGTRSAVAAGRRVDNAKF